MTDDVKTLQDLHDKAVSQIMKLAAELSGKDPALAYALIVSAEQQVRFALVNNLSQNLNTIHEKKLEEKEKAEDSALVQSTYAKGGNPFKLTAQIVPTDTRNIIKAEFDMNNGNLALREYKAPEKMKAGDHEK